MNRLILFKEFIMKIKYITSKLLLALAIGCFVSFASCSDDINIGKNIDESEYEDIYTNNAYLRDGKTNLVSNIVELYQDEYTTSVKLGLTKTPTSTTSAKVKVDTEYLAAYNLEHETDFELYPVDAISLDNNGTFTINGSIKTAEVGLSIKGNDTLDKDKTYAIPLTIIENSSDISTKDEKAKHCIYFVKDMRHLADVYKGDDVVKGFLFFEVNNVNPLNALSFELENGKLIWDVVVLFAANINYDAEAGRPRVQNNPNVQFLLDNNETYLQPLRKRGVKVLLGLLGNHDMAGLAQLSDQGAKDFARELAQYCKAYNLDGVNFDDEYSTSPDPSNPALTNISKKAAARLCYETKQMMPDKLVTVFAYGYMYGESSVDGVDAKEWIDIVVPNYGSRAYPIGQLTNKECAGLAAEFNLNQGGSLTPQDAQDLIRDGYGWHMGFDLKPTKYESILWRLSGVEVLYGSKLKEITTYYKNRDPKPYEYKNDGSVTN